MGYELPRFHQADQRSEEKANVHVPELSVVSVPGKNVHGPVRDRDRDH